MAVLKQILKTFSIALLLVFLMINSTQSALGAEHTEYTGTYTFERFDGSAIPIEIKVDIKTPLKYYVGESNQYLFISIDAEKSSEISDLSLRVVKCYLGNFEGERTSNAWFDFIVVEETGTEFDMRYEVNPQIEMENVRMSIVTSWMITYVNGTTESLGGFTIRPDVGPISVEKGTGFYLTNIVVYLPIIIAMIVILVVSVFIYRRVQKKKRSKK